MIPAPALLIAFDGGALFVVFVLPWIVAGALLAAVIPRASRQDTPRVLALGWPGWLLLALWCVQYLSVTDTADGMNRSILILVLFLLIALTIDRAFAQIFLRLRGRAY